MANLHELSETDRQRPHAALIRQQVDRITSSEVFAKADRSCQFLRFIVETYLREGPTALKETLIGVQVYGRPVGYDPKTEPIVRMQARRLRLKLEEYYGGPGRQDRVIITVPTGGYAPQFEIQPEAVPALVVMPEPPRPQSGLFSRQWQVAGTMGLLIALCAGLAWYKLAAGRSSSAPLYAVPVTRYAGLEFQPALSRDGQRIAFVWNGTEHNYNIYVKDLNSGEPKRLTTDSAYDLSPAWSPDGQQIAFLRLFPDNSKQIVIVPVAGGPERFLCRTQAKQPDWVQEASILSNLPGPAWSPDGQFLVVSDRPTTQDPDSLYLVSVQTGQKKRISWPQGADVGDYSPAFSPDGRTLAFVRELSYQGSSDLYLLQSLNRGAAQRITFDAKVIRGLAWRSGNQLIFSSNRLGDFLLWSVSIRGGMPELVGGTGHNVIQPTASADGRTLVYVERFRNANVWRVPLREQKPGIPQKLIVSSTSNDSAQYSQDGKSIVFVSDRSGVSALWICAADGSHPAVLFTGQGAPVGTPRWSPDGRQIAFDTVQKRHSAIELISAKGGKPRVLASGQADFMMPSWSRDGRFVYFVSPTGSETVQIWKQPVIGGSAFQVTQGGGGEAAEAPDGKTLYYLKGPAGIWQVPVWGGPETPVPGLEHSNTSRHFAVAVNGIYYLASENPPWTIHFYSFTTRQVSTVATIGSTPAFTTPSLSVSPDERWLLYTQRDQAGEDLMALQYPKP